MRTRIGSGLLLSIMAAGLIAIGASRPVAAQIAPAGTLQGTVTTIDAQGNRVPVVGAHVVADSVLKESIGMGDTNAAGDYGPFTLFPTVYTVTVTATGFQSASGTVGVNAGGASRLDFTLTRIAPAPTSRPPVVRRLSGAGGGPPLAMLIASLVLIVIGLRRARRRAPAPEA